jgi:hypothetical protein
VFNRRRHPSGLHECLLCHDDFVVPVRAEALELGRWDLRLRCGQCGTYRDVVVSDGVADRYDRDLQRGMSEITAALRQEDHDRMAAEARVFIAALEHDLIDAVDFDCPEQ